MKIMRMESFCSTRKARPRSSTNCPQVSDPFLRALLWGALWDSVRELRMAPASTPILLCAFCRQEKDAELAVSILGRLRGAFTDYLSDAQRAAIAERFENLLIREIAEAPTPDLRITYFRGLIAVATTAHARDVLKDLFAGRVTIPGVPLKQRDRWNIIGALIATGDASGTELLATESKRDTSDDGRKYTYVSGAGFAQAENKRKYFAEYLASSGVKEDWVTASLPFFNYWNQTALTSAYLQPALDALPQLEAGAEDFLCNELARELRREPEFTGGAEDRRRLSQAEQCRPGSAPEDSRSPG